MSRKQIELTARLILVVMFFFCVVGMVSTFNYLRGAW